MKTAINWTGDTLRWLYWTLSEAVDGLGRGLARLGQLGRGLQAGLAALNWTAVLAVLSLAVLCVGIARQYGSPAAMIVGGAIGLLTAIADVLLDMRGGK